MVCYIAPVLSGLQNETKPTYNVIHNSLLKQFLQKAIKIYNRTV